jgi:hypothetical protein
VVTFTSLLLYLQGKSSIAQEAWQPEPVWYNFEKRKFLNFLCYWDSNCYPSVIQTVASRHTDYATPDKD